MFLAGMTVALTGCGGGGGGDGSSSSQASVRTTINWAARSKAVNSPGSAQSAKITLTSTKDGSLIYSFVVNRQDNAAAYTDNVVSPKTISVPLDRAVTKIAFFTDKEAAGAEVGETLATVEVDRDGRLLGSDGKEAGFTVIGRVASVAVTGQNLAVGDSATLKFTAKTADGTTLILSDGSAAFALKTGEGVADVSPAGVVVAKATGTASVTATIDGVTSAAATINVKFGVDSIEIAPDQSVAVGGETIPAVTAKKADGSVIALPAGSITFAAKGGDGQATIVDGKLVGVAVGTVGVTATAEGKTSASTNVTITDGPIVTTATGLQYQELRLTNGTAVTTGKTVKVTYIGRLTDGSTFDSGDFSFVIDKGSVVAGFNEGVASMKVGAKRRLIIPPDLGYADNPPSGSKIPKNATLIFDVTVDSIQ